MESALTYFKNNLKDSGKDGVKNCMFKNFIFRIKTLVKGTKILYTLEVVIDRVQKTLKINGLYKPYDVRLLI